MSPHQEKLAAAKAERQRHIDAWRISGLTQAAYAAAQGIHATTFNGWLRAAQRALDAIAGVAGAAGDKEAAAAAAESATATINTAPVLTIRPVLVQSAACAPVSALPSPSSPSSPPSAPSPSPSIATLPIVHMMSPSINATVPESRITLHGLGGWRLRLTDSVSTTWLAALLRELDAAPTAPTTPKRAGTC